MNHIDAKVIMIEKKDNITLVSFSAQKQNLKMMSLGLNTPIKEGSPVTLGVKATSIALAKNLSGEISMSNQLPCTIVSLNKGELLCSITLRFGDALIESITTLKSASTMNLELEDEVIALIKASELSILEVR